MTDENEPGTQAPPVLRVLVVEDNRDAADTLGMLLGAWGFDHRIAYDGEDGLAQANEFRPDCLLLDAGLPGLDGYALAREVRRQPGMAAVKLVSISAYADDAHRSRVRESGFDYSLTKPADPIELEGLLRMLDQVMRLAGRTEELARQNVTLANETKELLQEVKQDLQEVKEEVRELKQELREVKEEIGTRREEDPGAS